MSTTDRIADLERRLLLAEAKLRTLGLFRQVEQTKSPIRVVSSLPTASNWPEIVWLTTDAQLWGTGPGGSGWLPLQKFTDYVGEVE